MMLNRPAQSGFCFCSLSKDTKLTAELVKLKLPRRLSASHNFTQRLCLYLPLLILEDRTYFLQCSTGTATVPIDNISSSKFLTRVNGIVSKKLDTDAQSCKPSVLRAYSISTITSYAPNTQPAFLSRLRHLLIETIRHNKYSAVLRSNSVTRKTPFYGLQSWLKCLQVRFEGKFGPVTRNKDHSCRGRRISAQCYEDQPPSCIVWRVDFSKPSTLCSD